MSGLIPQSFLNDLLQKTDIIELIDGYLPLKKAGTSFIACCPFHSEKGPSFNVIPKKQFYYCFGCGANGNSISFIMAYLNQSFLEAVDTLAARLGLEVPHEGGATSKQRGPDLHQLLEKINWYYQHQLKRQGQVAIDYLKARGVSGQIAKEYQLGYAPSAWHDLEIHFKGYSTELVTTGMSIQKSDGKQYDRFRKRIMFPIHDRNGRMLGFGGRVIDGLQKPKYLNSPETVIFQKGRELYGLHQVLQQGSSLHEILVVEGYMDVLALAQHGIKNVVATLGTATSVLHMQLLNRYTKRVVFCFDGDEAGRHAAWRALDSCLPHLHQGLDAGFVFLQEGQDPDTFIRERGREHFINLLKQALSLADFFFSNLAKNLDLQSIGGKSQLVQAAKPYLNKIQDGPYLQLLYDELARLSRIEESRLSQLIKNKETNHPKQPQTMKRSPIRLAVALLLQHPELFKNSRSIIHLHLLESPEHAVLKAILLKLETMPQATTATLLEQWRDTVHFNMLGKLAAWDHQIPLPALESEFKDIILFLQKQNLEHKINEYIVKSREKGLTIVERGLLQTLLKERHAIPDDKK